MWNEVKKNVGTEKKFFFEANEGINMELFFWLT